MRIERHPLVDTDVAEALAYTYREFGVAQVPVYERLIVDGLRTIGLHPTIGRLREDLGRGIRVYCIAQPGIRAKHGYIYRVKVDVIQIARLVHLARYLPTVIPEDF
jgi:plasmid stabilization system protein ParE